MSALIHIPKTYRPTPEDLPGDLSRIAEAIEEHLPDKGVELTLMLAQIFGGQPVYFHKVEYLLRQIRDDAMRCEYDQGGITMVELAHKYNICHSRVKQILSVPSKTSQQELKKRQRKLW